MEEGENGKREGEGAPDMRRSAHSTGTGIGSYGSVQVVRTTKLGASLFLQVRLERRDLIKAREEEYDDRCGGKGNVSLRWCRPAQAGGRGVKGPVATSIFAGSSRRVILHEANNLFLTALIHHGGTQVDVGAGEHFTPVQGRSAVLIRGEPRPQLGFMFALPLGIGTGSLG